MRRLGSPPPEVPPSRTPTPAWYPSPDPDLLTVSGVVPRSPASTVFTDVLGRALRSELCADDPHSYSAGATYAVRDADAAVVTVTADCLPGERAAVAGGFVDALARVRWGRLTAEMVGDVTRPAADEAARRTSPHETVAARAVDRCLGIPYPEPGELAAAYTAVGPDDVRACAEAFHASALAGVAEQGLGWAGWSPVPVGSPDAVTGRPHPARDGHGGSLVVAEDGVSLVRGGLRSTVRFAEVALLTSFADGGRHLVGHDGVQVEVEPTLYELDGGVVQRIDAAVDLARVVRRPARTGEDLPRAAPVGTPGLSGAAAPGPTEAPAEVRPRRSGWRDRLPRVGRRSS